MSSAASGWRPQSTQTAAALAAAGLDAAAVERLVRATLAEDLGAHGDITSNATVDASTVLTCDYVSRAPGVAAGIPVLAAIADIALQDGTFISFVADGDDLQRGTALARVSGNAREILALERTSLNLLGHLCGIATLTRRWVAAVAGTTAKIRDTRKTMPLLRELEKYAVRCGGGVNHRHGLHDAVLIKDNHVAAAGGVGKALDAVYAAYPDASFVIQVEVDGLDQLVEALEHGAGQSNLQILIDNFSTADSIEAVRIVRERAPHVLVEASGGLTLERAAEVASTGVDFLAIGALTHSVSTLDIGLDSVEE
jgi:nicotinate-nucleotide pyrophosphorylase (carboxylating)